MSALCGRIAALHAAFWRYDPWYRRLWFIWPPAAAALLGAWLIAGQLPQFHGGKWAKAANCATASDTACNATKHPSPAFPDEIVYMTTAAPGIITIDRSAFASSAAADRPRLTAGIAAYYRSEWQKGIDALKAADANDRNVQFVLALLNLGSNTYDSLHAAQDLLRKSADAGQRQASAVLGGTLMGWQGLPKDVPQGRRLIEDGAAASDSYAMRLAAIGYTTGEFGTRDPAKGIDLMRRAADSGDPVAMAYLAWFYESGLGGIARDEAKAFDYLHRSADGGVTGVQHMLAFLAWERYQNGEPQDPSEFFKWYERAYKGGHSIAALGNVAVNYWFARPPFADTRRSYSLLLICTRYAYAYCHFWLGTAFRTGSGTPVDQVKAYAALTVASQLGWQDPENWLQQLEGLMTPAAKTAGTELAHKVSAGLRPIPAVIELQTAEAIAGPSPWDAPQPQPATQQPPATSAATPTPSPPSSQASADWTACKEATNPDVGAAACERLINSGTAGSDLGWAQYNLGVHYTTKKSYDLAIAHYNEAIRLQTNLSSAKNNRGAVNLRLNNLDAAERDFDDVIAADPTFPLAHANRGTMYLLRNQPDRAIAETTEAIRLDPKLQVAYDERSRAYQAKGQWADVVADCTAALNLNSRDEACLERRGNAYLGLGRRDLALADLEAALRLEPRSAWALVTRGRLLRDGGQLDAAIKDLTDAIGVDPKNADAYGSRADTYTLKQQYDLAIADANKAIELNRSLAYAYAVRGRAHMELGRLDDALGDFNDAIVRQSSNPIFHYFSAVAQARIDEKLYAGCKDSNQRGSLQICVMGIDYASSLHELDEAIRLNPNYDDAYAYRGVLYVTIRQRNKGIADLRQALLINPKNDFARDKLRSIGVTP